MSIETDIWILTFDDDKALTVQSMRGDKERLLQVGFDGYLLKPSV